VKTVTAAGNNKQQIVTLFEKILNKGMDGLLDNLISVEYIDHNPVPGQAPGAEGIKNKLAGLRAAFPDIHFYLEDLVAEEDLVAARYYWEATHTGEFMGLPPTGKKVKVQGMDLYRFRGGKLVEHWDSIDQLGLLQQLGIIT
jgi:predicted ester cyclase